MPVQARKPRVRKVLSFSSSGQLGVEQFEERRIVEHGAVDATAVGSLDVCELETACLELGLVHQVGQRIGILHLRNTYHGTSHRQFFGAHFGQGTCHVVQLIGVFQGGPLVGACGQVLIVVLSLVVAGVEEILQVVESHGIEAELLLGGSREGEQQEEGKEHSLSFHIIRFYVVLRFCGGSFAFRVISSANIGKINDKKAYPYEKMQRNVPFFKNIFVTLHQIQ